MADEDKRYNKDDILEYPALEPYRHYESENGEETSGPQEEEQALESEEPAHLQTLRDLDDVYALAALLPADIAKIIRDVTDALSLDTQGKIIQEIKRRSNPPPHTPILPDDRGGKKKYIYYSDGGGNKGGDRYVADIFSSKPIFKVDVQPSKNLVDLSYDGYTQDDIDIKRHYTTEMTSLCQRFCQVMSTLAQEANMPDYSYLMQDFDGTAVTTDNKNLQHLIDYVSKSQVVYDQTLRLMNKTHTAENTLIASRAFHAAAEQRDRYLGEKYLNKMSSYAATGSNDLLEKSRKQAMDNYNGAAMNMFKYLDNATKMTNSILNMKIDQATAKAELSSTGSDIYAQTPLPQPTANSIDDAYDTTKSIQDKAQQFVEEQKKDAAKNISGGGSFDPSSLGGGNVDPKSVYDMLKKAGYTAIAACGILGNIQVESSFNTGADNGSHHGLCQWDYSDRWADCQSYAQSHNMDASDAGAQVGFAIQECLNGIHECTPNELNNASTPSAAADIWREYFERCGEQGAGGRRDAAEAFYQQYGNS